MQVVGWKLMVSGAALAGLFSGSIGAALAAENTASASVVIRLNGSQEGRTFEGIGVLSAGGASRLALDYPEAIKSQILDLLFKPNYGAALQHLKVEVGGDANSTMGTEPSHMHTRTDENYQRGYEWWLMKEAKKRNPAILLDCLEWGAPGWIGDGKFYSQDNADYLVKFIKGLQSTYELEMNYVGIWNETPYDPAWIKLLRKTLDSNGLKTVKIVAADVFDWRLADEIKADPELGKAIDVIGVHYPGYESTPSAQACGKSLWSSEEGAGTKNGWPGACMMAKAYNRNYIQAKMTKTVAWGLLSSYYDTCLWPDCGLLKADTPWSGNYEVQPSIWATAHTTQFVQPGWVYLDREACGMLTGGGSYVTLKSPNGSDYSIIIETTDAKEPQPVTFQLEGGLPTSEVHMWRTTPQEQFMHVKDITPANGALAVTLNPNSIYTLSTTTGQQKGAPPVPPEKPFPLPYQDDFEASVPFAMPRYFADMGGSFEVADRSDGKGRCMRQVAPLESIRWRGAANPEPETILGSREWRNYTVGIDALIEKSGSVALFGRIALVRQDLKLPSGYRFKVDHTGAWELRTDQSPLAWGKTAFSPDAWHRLELAFTGETIRAVVDGAKVVEVRDTTYRTGMVGIGSGWNYAQFDNFAVAPTP
jgi:hypothetical protein